MGCRRWTWAGGRRARAGAGCPADPPRAPPSPTRRGRRGRGRRQRAAGLGEHGPKLAELGASQTDQQHRRPVHPLRKVLQEVEQLGLGPLDVVDHHDQGLPAARDSTIRRIAQNVSSTDRAGVAPSTPATASTTRTRSASSATNVAMRSACRHRRRPRRRYRPRCRSDRRRARSRAPRAVAPDLEGARTLVGAERRRELAGEPRLSHARRAQHGDEHGGQVGARTLERSLQARESPRPGRRTAPPARRSPHPRRRPRTCPRLRRARRR